jgi:hypothetical protein
VINIKEKSKITAIDKIEAITNNLFVSLEI